LYHTDSNNSGTKKRKENKGNKEKEVEEKAKKNALFIYMNVLMTYNTTIPRTWH